ncbi:MAG: hypothetical protein ACYC9L_03235 [Sulfuricaulis sp.]
MSNTQPTQGNPTIVQQLIDRGIEICGIRYQFGQLGSTDRFMLIAGGNAAGAVATRVQAPSDDRILDWVNIFISADDVKAIVTSSAIGGGPADLAAYLQSQLEATRSFVWKYRNDDTTRHSDHPIRLLVCGSVADPLPAGVPHEQSFV